MKISNHIIDGLEENVVHVQWIWTAVFVISLTIAFIWTYQMAIPAEDAVILFDYSKNLATRGVITYSENPTPIEGATDFLWMVTIALFSKIGVTEFGAALVLNYAGTLLLCHLLRVAQVPAWSIVVGILATPYLYASLQGFSAIAFSSAYVLCLSLALRKDNRLYAAVLLLCLIRPDGVIWGAGLILTRLIDVSVGDLRLECGRLFKYLIIPGVAYFLWRAWYFQEWLPLPFIVKSTGNNGLSYTLISYLAPAIVPIALAMLFAENRSALVKRAIVLFSVPAFFYASIRLEQNIGNRFLAPMFFGALVVFAENTKNKFISENTAFLLVSVYMSWSLTVGTFLALVNSRAENVYSISLELQHMRGKMLVTEAGRLAYFNNWEVHDSWGLNTPYFAHNLLQPAHVEEGSYDLIVAHCALGLLRHEHVSTDNSQRDWANNCRVLTSVIRNDSDYDIILVPFMSDTAPHANFGDAFEFSDFLGLPTKCSRYDIFAVSRAYPQANQVKRILFAHGGLPFDPTYAGYFLDLRCST